MRNLYPSYDLETAAFAKNKYFAIEGNYANKDQKNDCDGETFLQRPVVELS